MPGTPFTVEIRVAGRQEPVTVTVDQNADDNGAEFISKNEATELFTEAMDALNNLNLGESEFNASPLQIRGETRTYDNFAALVRDRAPGRGQRDLPVGISFRPGWSLLGDFGGFASSIGLSTRWNFGDHFSLGVGAGYANQDLAFNELSLSLRGAEIAVNLDWTRHFRSSSLRAGVLLAFLGGSAERPGAGERSPQYVAETCSEAELPPERCETLDRRIDPIAESGHFLQFLLGVNLEGEIPLFGNQENGLALTFGAAALVGYGQVVTQGDEEGDPRNEIGSFAFQALATLGLSWRRGNRPAEPDREAMELATTTSPTPPAPPAPPAPPPAGPRISGPSPEGVVLVTGEREEAEAQQTFAPGRRVVFRQDNNTSGNPSRWPDGSRMVIVYQGRDFGDPITTLETDGTFALNIADRFNSTVEIRVPNTSGGFRVARRVPIRAGEEPNDTGSGETPSCQFPEPNVCASCHGSGVARPLVPGTHNPPPANHLGGAVPQALMDCLSAARSAIRWVRDLAEGITS